MLVNIDSEVEGVFTIGCAGGINTEAHFKYDFHGKHGRHRQGLPESNGGCTTDK